MGSSLDTPRESICKIEIIVQEKNVQKRDIVDTKTHALSANGPKRPKKRPLPTIWGKAERAIWKRVTEALQCK